jgi:hypothetical protein
MSVAASPQFCVFCRAIELISSLEEDCRSGDHKPPAYCHLKLHLFFFSFLSVKFGPVH